MHQDVSDNCLDVNYEDIATQIQYSTVPENAERRETYLSDSSENKIYNESASALASEEIINAKIDFFSKIYRVFKSFEFTPTEVQSSLTIKLFIELAELCLNVKDYKLLKTEDEEVQIYKELTNGYCSLIIDEFGGLTYLVMKQKGSGYYCDYYKNENISDQVKKDVVKKFSLL